MPASQRLLSVTFPLMWSALVALPALSACGGAIGEAVRPQDLTGAGAVGGAAAACKVAPKLARPLVVDLDGDSRALLEASLNNKKKRGVVVVNYDCANLRVLPNCRLADGNYEYAGVDKQESVVQIKNQDDLSVNLPLSAGKFGSQVQSGRTIDLALVLIGMRSTTVDTVKKSDLTGGCDGATHFVQLASVGAFSMATGSVGKAVAAAELFNVGASGSSEASRNAANKSGSLEVCNKADPDAPDAPSGCRAPISLQLVAISDAASTAPVKAAGAPKREEDKSAPPEENPCREGYMFAKGICTRATEEAHLCKPNDTEDCRVQCDRGSFESCYNYALAARRAGGGEVGKPQLLKACEHGVSDACGMYGIWLIDYRNDASPSNKDAQKFLRKGCNMGSGYSCFTLGERLTRKTEDGTQPDVQAGLRAYERACALGEQLSCSVLGDMYFDGENVPEDKPKGLLMLDRACASKSPNACSSLSQKLKDGPFKDHERAFRAAMHVCTEFRGVSCDDAIRVMIDTGHPKEAFETSKATCAVWNFNCVMLGELYEKGVGTSKDPAKAREAWTKACEDGKPSGTRSACEKIGVKPRR